jgi:hypothetical protein
MVIIPKTSLALSKYCYMIITLRRNISQMMRLDRLRKRDRLKRLVINI